MPHLYRHPRKNHFSRRRQNIRGACLAALLASSPAVLADGISIGIGLPTDPIIITPSGGDFTLAGSFTQINPPLGGTHINATIVQPDGTIAAAGSGKLVSIIPSPITISARANKISMSGFDLGPIDLFAPRPYIERYTSTGAANNFAGTGNSLFLPLPYGAITALATETDNRLVAAGNIQAPATTSTAFLSRVLSDGTLDDTFGDAGIISNNFGFREFFVNALVIKADGKIVLAGCGETQQAALHPVVIQLLSNGTLDTSFSLNGIAPISTPSAACATAIVAQPDNTLLLTATTQGDDPQQGIVVKISDSGELDTHFNGTGRREISHASASISLDNLALRHDGRVVAIGSLTSGDDQSILLIGLLADGSIDRSVSNVSDYHLFSPIPPATRTVGRQVLVQPNGDILMIAEQDEGEDSRRDILVARPFGDAIGNGNYYMPAQQGDASPRHLHAAGAVVLPDATLLLGTEEAHYLQIRLRDADFNRTTEAWDVTPASLQIPLAAESGTGLVTSGVMTVSGLEPGIAAPFVVTGAEYALNSPSNFQEGYAWLTNGDQIQLRFQRNEQSSVRLAVGGTQNNNSPAVLLTDDVVRQATFSVNSEEENDGGALGFGLMGIMMGIMVAIGLLRRKRQLRRTT